MSGGSQHPIISDQNKLLLVYNNTLKAQTVSIFVFDELSLTTNWPISSIIKEIQVEATIRIRLTNNGFLMKLLLKWQPKIIRNMLEKILFKVPVANQIR
jgi:hypothetical protein